MLVLSRKRQQAIVIGATGNPAQVCRVTVLEISGGTVRLGIEVDDQVVVLRAEIADQADSSARFDVRPQLHRIHLVSEHLGTISQQ